jgi:large subunit ribosomal protein L25
MKKIEIKTTLRKDLGKKATKTLRAEENVPCVMYGGKENLHFYAHRNSFKDLVYTHNIYLIKLEIDGKTYNAVLKDLQFHPVTDHILHLDFLEVVPGKPVEVVMPVELKGNPKGVLEEGGKLRFRRRQVRIRGLVENIPDSLEIDISVLAVGDTIKIEDIDYEGIELIGPPKAMIVGVISSKKAAASFAAEEAAEGEEGEEGEESEEGAEGAEAKGEGEEKSE